MTRAMITAVALTRSFKDKSARKELLALDNVNLVINKGQMTALIGPDGAGKTTFLRLVCGLLTPSSGRLEVLGLDVNRYAEEIQTKISYMPQKFGLYEDLTVKENLDLYADLHGVSKLDREPRFQRLLSMTGLEGFTDRLAGNLSGGMKQKLGLACTLVRSPEILLLDEPTVGVDPLSRRELWEILQQLVTEEDLTVLVSTAYMDEAALCQNVIIMYAGKVLTQGTPEALRSSASDLCYKLQPPAQIPARVAQAALLDDDNVIDAVPEGGAVRFLVRSSEVLPKLNIYRYLGGLATWKVPARLEDSFMLLLSKTMPDHSRFAVGFELDYRQDYTLSTAIDIEVSGLVRRFGDFVAVNSTSFSVRRGEIFGLLGPNGAGKTTTFRMLCGLLPASSGSLFVAGTDVRQARAQARARLGYVAQKFSLYGSLTVDENLRFYAGVYGLNKQEMTERIAEVKEQFGLQEVGQQEAGQLPGGYKQRLSMAAALLHHPRILFLDEPTSGIDPLARRTFWRQITALATGGTTIIVTTHFMEEAEYCDRVMIQDQGKMLAIGTPDEIRRQGAGAPDMNQAFIAIVEQHRKRARE